MPTRDPYIEDGKEHVCSSCLRTFPSLGKLRDHVARTHEGATVEVLQ